MSKVKIEFLVLFVGAVFILNSPAAHAVIKANSGDVVVFNTPIQTYLPFQMRLLVCTKANSCASQDLEIIGKPSSILKSKEYYVFSLNKIKNTGKKTIYAQMKGLNESNWSTGFVLINDYEADESPFYQFICWYSENKIPNCSTGSDDNLLPD